MVGGYGMFESVQQWRFIACVETLFERLLRFSQRLGGWLATWGAALHAKVCDLVLTYVSVIHVLSSGKDSNWKSVMAALAKNNCWIKDIGNCYDFARSKTFLLDCDQN